MTHDIWGPFGSEPHILIVRIVLGRGSGGRRLSSRLARRAVMTGLVQCDN
jgi:hypothetical protein